MLEKVLTHIHNWFAVDTRSGDYRISDGVLEAPEGMLQADQYFRIVGSVFNDGLHQWPTNSLKDEEFNGAIQALAIPKAVIDLAAEISEWQDKYGSVVDGPYQSESFSDYSYSKATLSGDGSNGSPSWQTVFRSRLNPWRKIG